MDCPLLPTSTPTAKRGSLKLNLSKGPILAFLGSRKRGAAGDKEGDSDTEVLRGRLGVFLRLLGLVVLAQVSLILFCAFPLKCYSGLVSPFSLAMLAGPAPPCSADKCSTSSRATKRIAGPFDVCDLEIAGGRPGDGYGAWPLCRNHVPSNCTVFSFGIGGDVSFDLSMIKRGCTVYGFDPTVPPVDAKGLFLGDDAPLADSFHFMQVGLGEENGVASFMSPKDPRVRSMTSLSAKDTTMWRFRSPKYQAAVLTLPTLMAATKQSQVDLLKIDVEGIEFDVCESEDFLSVLDNVGQILFEFHERLLKNPQGRKARCSQLLLEKGFKEVKRTRSEEYVFARMAPTNSA